MKPRRRWLHLCVLLSLLCGAIAYLPIAPPAVASAGLTSTPPPPAEEAPPALMASPPAPPAPTDEQVELFAGLAALELAREQGPEAVVALAQTLRGAALDAAMSDIVAAHEQVVRSAPPRPETAPVTPAEEAEMLKAQAARDSTGRDRALLHQGDPAENNAPPASEPLASEPLASEPPASEPLALTADRTVGSGCTYPTLSAAIAAASSGDRLLIAGGVTFNERVVIDKNLTLQGGYNGCGSASTARTTLNGGGSGTVVVINPGLTVTLTRLNLTHGSTGFEGGGIRFAWGSGGGTLTLDQVDIYGNTAQWGGGLWVGPNAQVTGTDVDIYNNTATTFGGGVRLFGGRATFSEGDIHDNTAPAGAGVYATLEEGSAPVLNLPSYADVHSNQALTGTGFGGGVYMSQGTLTMADCSDLYANTAIQGGGAYLITSTLTMAGECSEIMLNTAAADGGGVRAQDSTLNLRDGAELYANTAAGSGGGAYLDKSTLWGDQAHLRYNTAQGHGGGVYATNGAWLDMDLGTYPCPGPRCSQVSYNTSEMYGGGVCATGSSTVDLGQTFVENNVAMLGGAIYASGSTVLLNNTLIARNNATSTAGDGVRLYLGATLTGAHTTFAHNNGGGAVDGRAIDQYQSTLSLTNAIVWGHTSSISDLTQSVTCSNIQGGYAGTGNLNVDPLFVAPSSADFHLQSTSPVIDRCATGQSLDFDNAPRPVVGVRPATPFDMGADEFSTPRVGINGSGCLYGSLSQAVAAAGNGDTLQVAADTFHESVNTSGKSLTIAGGYAANCTTLGPDTTIVDGSWRAASVFDIPGGVVTLRNLRITGGNAIGGGVDADYGARATLDTTTVTGNTAPYGGGIYVGSTAILTLTNGSRVRNNTATVAGGGARVWGKLVGISWSASIAENSAPDGGGVSVPGGVLDLRPAHVQDNWATGATGRGGGIHVYDGGVVNVTASANVSGNRAYDGAGLYAGASTVDLFAVLHDNAASNHGGGIYLTQGGTLSANNTRIGYAYTTGKGGNEALRGAGLYVNNGTVSFTGDIWNNRAGQSGAGIYADNSVLTLTGATIGGTGAYEANQLGANGNTGVGLYLTNGTHATLAGSTVTSNTFQTAGFTYGGGAYVVNGSVMTLTGSTIARHLAPSAPDGRGAGVYVMDSTVTLDNSKVLSNTAGTVGGGVRLWGTSTLNVLNGSELLNNHALNGVGGAVAAGGTPDINISDTTLAKNTATADGGAIHLSDGTLDFTGAWTLRENTAGDSGGAVAAVNTAVVNFTAAGYSMAYLNRAQGGNGGMLYLGSNATTKLYATAGYELYIDANQAGGNGGALYADNNGFFDTYGQVNFHRNRAANGGAIYLSNGSRVWLDDYTTTRPQLWDNWADSGSGGAIYAVDSPRVRCDGATFGKPGKGNQATGSGGAIFLSGSTLDATNCGFLDNRAGDHGGAIAAYTAMLTIFATYSPATLAAERAAGPEPLGANAILATACNPTVEACSVFSGNVANSSNNEVGDGGAIYARDSALQVSHTALHRNAAYRGGAIYQTGTTSAGEVANSLIYSNTVSFPLGAGIRSGGGAFTVTHATLAHNIGGSGFSGQPTAVYNTIAWGNDGYPGFTLAPTSGACNIDNSGNAGLNVDPQFAAPGAGENYRLRVGSPAIDACATGLSPDLYNTPRPYGLAYDMGMAEYALAMALSPNRSGTGPSPGLVTYTHTLTNTGGAIDTYTLSAHSSNGWNVTLEPAAPVMLKAGQGAPITVTLAIPTGVLSGTLDTLTLTATSTGDPSLTASVTATTRTYQERVTVYLPVMLRNRSR